MCDCGREKRETEEGEKTDDERKRESRRRGRREKWKESQRLGGCPSCWDLREPVSLATEPAGV